MSSMRTPRLPIALVACALPLAVACASFQASGDAPSAADASTDDAGQPHAEGSTSVDAGDAGDVCASVSDEFEGAGLLGTAWSEYLHDTSSSEALVLESPDSTNHILQSNAVGSNNGSQRFAYLRATLDDAAKSVTCGFAFRPDTDFFTNNQQKVGDGPGLDIFVVALVHGDGSKTLLRFSYKSGTIEVRDDFTDGNDVCTDPANTCPDDDKATPALGMAEHQWSNMTVTTDFRSVTFTAETKGTVAEVQYDFTDPTGPVTALQLYLGVANFGNATQLGSYDHFHCELHC